MTRTTKILLADDHPLFIKGLTYLLKKHGFNNIIAKVGNGIDAFRIIEKQLPEIAILDINMPGLSGIEILEKIYLKELPVKIIFLTMLDDPSIFNPAISFGAMGYLLKDSAEEEIINALVEVSCGRPYITPTLSKYLINSKNSILNTDEVKTSLSKLSPSEIKVMKFVAMNITTEEIAEKLFISPRTVDRHRSNICKKLNLKGNNALLRFALFNKEILINQ